MIGNWFRNYKILLLLNLTVLNFPINYALTEQCTTSSCNCNSLDSSTKRLRADVTFSVDAGDSIVSYANFNAILRWILNYIVQDAKISQYDLAISLQVVRENATASDYNYYISDVCTEFAKNFLHAGTNMPPSPSTYKIFNDYLLSSKQYGRAGYPQTLVFITAAQNDSILNAVEIANVVSHSGTQLLIIGVGQNDTSKSNFLYQLSDNVKLSSQFDLSFSKQTFARWVIDAINTTKVASPPSSPFWRPDAPKSLADAIGTPCSTNFFQSDMSVNILIDSTISQSELDDLGIYLADILSGLHLDGNKTNSSCVGLIKYDTASATYIRSLETCATYDDLFEQLSDLSSVATSDNNSHPDLFKALNMSLGDYKISSPAKHRLLLVTNQAYKSSDEKSIQDISDQLKQMKVFIVTVDYSSDVEESESTSIQLFRSNQTKTYTNRSLSTTKLLQSICSGEQSFSKNDTDLETLITNTFAYTNCQCPRSLTQLTLVDPQTHHKALFSDCLLGVIDPSTAYSAEKQCEALGGSLVSLTSKEKFDFVHDRIIKTQLPGVSAYWTGLALRPMDNTLNWYYYDRLNLPVGNNNKLVPDTSHANATAYCGRVSVNSQSKGGPILEFASCNSQLPFVCQIHAFDADHPLN